MGYEVDFLPVGKESKSGDAIALRYGDLTGGSAQKVVVIDGGYLDDGKALVDHIRTYYKSNSVDLVISTHPDRDHINGLDVVLSEMDVGQLWVHRPSLHSVDLALSRQLGYSNLSLSESVIASLKDSDELAGIAASRGIPVVEPFTGVSFDGVITVLGPDADYYESLLSDINTRESALTAVLQKLAEAVRGLLPESWFEETLTDGGDTTPGNNTSVITLFRFDDHQLLFTGDAGIPALERAAVVRESFGAGPGRLRFVQVPHHGSRRNVGPTILDRILGGVKAEATQTGSAVVSAAKEGAPKHPAKTVTNAFRRRGYPVVATQGNVILYRNNAPERPGWGPVDPLPMYSVVEEDPG